MRIRLSQDSIIEKPRAKSKENVGRGKRIEEPRSDDDEKSNDEKCFGSRKSEKIIITDESEQQEQGGTPVLLADIAEKKCKDQKEIKLKATTGSKNVIKDRDFEEVEEKRNSRSVVNEQLAKRKTKEARHRERADIF